ncbi:hypothetical protein AAVH_19204 [Aphelenchoides avenae]|nr:hypothetical protein AAVH_19204 [Aphelenchus avenae]
MSIAKQTATVTVAAEKFYKLVEEKLDEKFKKIDENMKLKNIVLKTLIESTHGILQEFNDNLTTLAERLDAIDKQLQALKNDAKDSNDNRCSA